MRSGLFIILVLVLPVYAASQCAAPDPDIWANSWTSCQASLNPNALRGAGHWIQYDLGSMRKLSKVHVWNTNDPSQLGNGFRNVTVDYSEDGINWTELGSYAFPQGTGEAAYAGFEGFDFAGAYARYVVLTATSNWGGSCYGLAEVKFNLSFDIDYAEGVFLPVEFLFFSATPAGSIVELRWATSSEENSSHFVVERSGDGVEWEDLLQVAAAGNSTVRTNYQAADFNPLRGTSYYRLRQVDFDGSEQYSDLATVRFSGPIDPVLVFPNPGSGWFYLQGAPTEISEVRVFNTVGEEIYPTINRSIGNDLLAGVNLTAYPAGMYIIKTQTSTQRVVKF